MNHTVIQHRAQNCIHFHLSKLWPHFTGKDLWCALCALSFTYSVSHTTSLSGCVWLIWYRKHLYMAWAFSNLCSWVAQQGEMTGFVHSIILLCLIQPESRGCCKDLMQLSKNKLQLRYWEQGLTFPKSLNKIISRGNECLVHDEISSVLCIVTQLSHFFNVYLHIINLPLKMFG